MCLLMQTLSFLYFKHPAPTAIYTLSLHDALPISALPIEGLHQSGRTSANGVHTGAFVGSASAALAGGAAARSREQAREIAQPDRKSTRLNSSHEWISYAVFCLKKKSERQHRT